MADKTSKLIKSMGSRPEIRTPIATDMFLPNHSGTHDAGILNKVPAKDNDLANKKYVDDSITAIGIGNYVPYIGATANVNLGSWDLITDTITSINGVTSLTNNGSFW